MSRPLSLPSLPLSTLRPRLALHPTPCIPSCICQPGPPSHLPPQVHAVPGNVLLHQEHLLPQLPQRLAHAGQAAAHQGGHPRRQRPSAVERQHGGGGVAVVALAGRAHLVHAWRDDKRRGACMQQKGFGWGFWLGRPSLHTSSLVPPPLSRHLSRPSFPSPPIPHTPVEVARIRLRDSGGSGTCAR